MGVDSSYMERGRAKEEICPKPSCQGPFTPAATSIKLFIPSCDSSLEIGVGTCISRDDEGLEKTSPVTLLYILYTILWLVLSLNAMQVNWLTETGSDRRQPRSIESYHEGEEGRTVVIVGELMLSSREGEGGQGNWNRKGFSVNFSVELDS